MFRTSIIVAAALSLSACAGTVSVPPVTVTTAPSIDPNSVIQTVLAQCGWIVPVADVLNVFASGVPIASIANAICSTFGPKPLTQSGRLRANARATVRRVNGVPVSAY